MHCQYQFRTNTLNRKSHIGVLVHRGNVGMDIIILVNKKKNFPMQISFDAFCPKWLGLLQFFLHVFVCLLLLYRYKKNVKDLQESHEDRELVRQYHLQQEKRKQRKLKRQTKKLNPKLLPVFSSPITMQNPHLSSLHVW